MSDQRPREHAREQLLDLLKEIDLTIADETRWRDHNERMDAPFSAEAHATLLNAKATVLAALAT